MSDFKASDHNVNIQGKDYLPVAARVVWARREHEDWSITATPVQIGDTMYMRATVATVEGHILSTAHKAVRPGGKGAVGMYPVESAETGAIGRALGLCGYGTLAGDLDEGDEIADAPVERKGEPIARTKTALEQMIADAAPHDEPPPTHLEMRDAAEGYASRVEKTARGDGVRAAIEACNGDPGKIEALWTRIVAIEAKPHRVNAAKLWATALADVAGPGDLARLAALCGKVAPEAAAILREASDRLAAKTA